MKLRSLWPLWLCLLIASSFAFAQVTQTDWHAFIKANAPKTVHYVGVYVGTPSPIEVNSHVRFRPASVQKILTASAYVAHLGMNERVTQTLKHSLNAEAKQMAEDLGASLGENGPLAVQDHATALIQAALIERKMVASEIPVFIEYSKKEALKNPFQIVCQSGDGDDGEDSKPSEPSTITPHAMGLYLEELARKPYFLDILRSLPYAGIKGASGTLGDDMAIASHRRFLGPADFARGRAAMKTGTLGTISNLAGYIHTEAGYVPFVIFIKHELEQYVDAHGLADKIVNQLARDLEATTLPEQSL